MNTTNATSWGEVLVGQADTSHRPQPDQRRLATNRSLVARVRQPRRIDTWPTKLTLVCSVPVWSLSLAGTYPTTGPSLRPRAAHDSSSRSSAAGGGRWVCALSVVRAVLSSPPSLPRYQPVRIWRDGHRSRHRPVGPRRGMVSRPTDNEGREPLRVMLRRHLLTPDTRALLVLPLSSSLTLTRSRCAGASSSPARPSSVLHSRRRASSRRISSRQSAATRSLSSQTGAPSAWL